MPCCCMPGLALSFASVAACSLGVCFRASCKILSHLASPCRTPLNTRINLTSSPQHSNQSSSPQPHLASSHTPSVLTPMRNIRPTTRVVHSNFSHCGSHRRWACSWKLKRMQMHQIAQEHMGRTWGRRERRYTCIKRSWHTAEKIYISLTSCPCPINKSKMPTSMLRSVNVRTMPIDNDTYPAIQVKL